VRTYSFLPVTFGLFLLAALPAPADVLITSNYFQSTFTDLGGLGQQTVSHGPATVPLTQLSQSIGAETSQATLYGSATPGTFHGYVQSFAAAPESVDSGGPYVVVTNSQLVLRADDDLLFTSSTLPIGTPVSFMFTADLHSILTSDTAGNCSPVSFIPAGSAILEPNNGSLFTPLDHNTCGTGSDNMSFSGIFHSEVGDGTVGPNDPGDFPISISLVLESQASNFPIASDTTTVDASSTGNIYVQVLTPDVTFSSASGATYQPTTSAVPEPGTLPLIGAAMVGMEVMRRKASRTRR